MSARSLGPRAGSYRPPRVGRFRSSRRTGFVICLTDIRRISSVVRKEKDTPVTEDGRGCEMFIFVYQNRTARLKDAPSYDSTASKRFRTRRTPEGRWRFCSRPARFFDRAWSRYLTFGIYMGPRIKVDVNVILLLLNHVAAFSAGISESTCRLLLSLSHHLCN